MSVKLALVTGASRGLGAAITMELTAKGWHVVAVARTVGGLEDLDDHVKKNGATDSLTLAPMDITNEDAMRYLCRSIYDRWGSLGLWVHSAIHTAPLTPTSSIDTKDLDKSIAINMRASSFLISMVEPLLTLKNGTAVFFDDTTHGQKFLGAYGATKAGQMALARTWQAETATLSPKVVIKSPSPMPTALRARFYPGEDRSKLSPTSVEAKAIVESLT